MSEKGGDEVIEVHWFRWVVIIAYALCLIASAIVMVSFATISTIVA